MQPLKIDCLRQVLSLHPSTHTDMYTQSNTLYRKSTILAKEKHAEPDCFAIKISMNFLLLLELSREV